MKHHGELDDSMIAAEVGQVELADDCTIEGLRILFIQQQTEACAKDRHPLLLKPR